jgi:beta-N-acetylhexosaminidase
MTRGTSHARHAAPDRPDRPEGRARRWPLGLASGAVALTLTVAVAYFAVHWTGSDGHSPFGHVQASQPATSHPASAVTSHPSAKPTSATLSRLSAAQLAGQRVIYSYTGLTPPASLLRWISRGEVGGVIFFSGNVASDTQLAGVIAELDRANASRGNPMRGYPLLLMTDQEGGEVRRLPGAPELSEAQIGQSADAGTQAADAGAGAAANLAGVGMNVNLAPVLDVYRAAGDFDDQYGRSYSTDPHEVSSLGADFIRAQQAGHVAATAKHFPGLGAADAAQDTDLRPVTLDVPLRQLRGVDELPYQAAIAAGVKLVMVSWAIYPALDPGVPAGLSSAIVSGELRQRLGFTGVTITDALEAGALAPFGSIAHRATLAAGAGMDLLLCSQQTDTEGEQARIALADGYSSGSLDHGQFSAALTRILALRASLRH